MAPDAYAHLKDNAWREIADIDARLERGEIDNEQVDDRNEEQR